MSQRTNVLSESRTCSSLLFRFMFVALIVLFFSKPCFAVFHEQMAISTRGISLSNTCTADPPGLMSMHYNPAGLSILPDGKVFEQGLTIPVILMTKRLEADPDADTFLNKWGPNVTDTVKPENTDPLAGTEGTTGPLMYLPLYDDTIPFLFGPTMGVSSRPPDSRWTVAIGSYAPFAAGFTHDEPDDPLRFQAKNVVQQHLLYATPSASYKVNDTLSLGFSVGFGQTATIASMDMRSPSDMIALTKMLGEATEGLEIPIVSELTLPSPWFGGGVGPYDKLAQVSMKLRDDFSPSYNLGVLWQPKQWLGFGVTYQSEISTELVGRYSIQHSPQFTAMMNWMSQGMVLPVAAASLNLPTSGEDQYGYCSSNSFSYPQRIQAGIKLKPIEQVKLLFDLQWADWSVVKEDRFVFDQNISLLRLVNIMGYGEQPNQMVLPRNFEDTLHWSVGLELMPLDWLTLRLGYEMRPTSVQNNLYDGLYSLPDLHNIGTGLGIKLKNGVNLDLAFAYMFNDSFSIPNGTSMIMNSDDWTKPVYNPFVGLDYYQETKIYLFSGSVTMPLDIFVEQTKHSIDGVKNIFNFMNPFD